MKNKSLKQSAVSLVVSLATFASTLLMQVQPASAAGFNVNEKKVKFTLDCNKPEKVNQFCDEYFGNPPSDEECSQLGAANEGKFNPNKTGAAPDYSAGTCSVTVTLPAINKASEGSKLDPEKCKTDMNCLSKACTIASKSKKKCLLKDGQLQPHCAAYTAIDGDGTFPGTIAADVLLATVDFAVAGVCAAECASPGLNVVGQACRMGAMAAGAAELFSSIAMTENGKVAKYIGEFGGILGAGSGVAGAAAHGLTNNTASASDKVACVSAGLFAVMGGARVVAANNMGSARDAQCESINSLLSELSTFDENGSGSGGSGSGNLYASSPGTGTNGSDSSAGSGGNMRTSAEAASQTYDECRNKGGTASACIDAANKQQGLQATDAELIRKSGLPAFPITDIKKLAGEAGRLNAGSIASNALGGGEIGNAVAALAQAAQDNPKELASLGNLAAGSTYAGGGGGAGGGSKSSDSSNPFAGLFGAKDGGPAVGGAGSQSFGSRAPSNDIWHTGTTQNLFEIVSTKVSQVVSRVMPK